MGSDLTTASLPHSDNLLDSYTNRDFGPNFAEGADI